jgi:hypothetical protein
MARNEKHKLGLLDRLRGWYWYGTPWFDYQGDYVGTIWRKVSND